MKTSELAKMLARELRKDQTKSEKLFWVELRNRKFAGFKFNRQHPIYYFKDGQKKFFIADFFCNELKLVIELDGEIHESQKEYDQVREELLQTKKRIILRFKNEEIETSINASLIKLKRSIEKQLQSQLNKKI